MKIFMPAANEGWIGDITTSEFKSHTRHDVVDDIAAADVVWMYSKWIANHYDPRILRAKPCITTVHHIVPEKGIDITFFDSFTDVYHVPNKITFNELQKRTDRKIVRLPYWVPTAFHQLDDSTLKLLTGDIVTNSQFVFGSFQRDTEGASILTTPQPKLEKGPDVLAALLERFWDDDYKLFLAGWRRQYIKSRVPSFRLIDYTENKSPDGKAFDDHSGINIVYNILRASNGIYLVTSRYEGGPQAILEASAVGCKILTTNVGIASEVLHPLCICGQADDSLTVDMFESKIRSDLPWDEIIAYNKKSVEALRVQSVIHDYDALIDNVANSN